MVTIKKRPIRWAASLLLQRSFRLSLFRWRRCGREWCGVRRRDDAGLAARIPLRFPGGVGEPADGVDHGGDSVGHLGEVDGAEFVAGLVVVLVEAEAGG